MSGVDPLPFVQQPAPDGDPGAPLVRYRLAFVSVQALLAAPAAFVLLTTSSTRPSIRTWSRQSSAAP